MARRRGQRPRQDNQVNFALYLPGWLSKMLSWECWVWPRGNDSTHILDWSSAFRALHGEQFMIVSLTIGLSGLLKEGLCSQQTITVIATEAFNMPHFSQCCDHLAEIKQKRFVDRSFFITSSYVFQNLVELSFHGNWSRLGKVWNEPVRVIQQRDAEKQPKIKKRACTFWSVHGKQTLQQHFLYGFIFYV